MINYKYKLNYLDYDFLANYFDFLGKKLGYNKKVSTSVRKFSVTEI